MNASDVQKMFDAKDRARDNEIARQIEREREPVEVADPNCRVCHGEGSYYEDVAGDGGPRMQVACDCLGWTPDPQDSRIAEAARRYALAYVRYAVAQIDDPNFQQASTALSRTHSDLLEACEPSLAKPSNG